jgi:multiple sugar transport system substrate-binding protein
MSRREFLKAAGLGLTAAGLSSCYVPAVTPVPSEAEPAPAPTVRPKAEEISVLVVGDPFQFALEKVVDDFTEETGIKVNLESLAYDALNARLITSFVSQTPDADVVTVDAMWVGQYSDNGWIRTLDDYIKADCDVDLKDFIPEVLYSLNTWRGHFVSLPIAAYGQGTMYRTDVFEAAGLEPPPTDPEDSAGWTWDKYKEMVEGLQGMDMEGTELFGTVIVGAQPVPIVHMYTQVAANRGVRWFNQFPEAPWDFEPTINSPENVEALEFYNALYGHQLCVVRRRHAVLAGRYRHVLLVDALLLPGEERRLYERRPVGHRRQIRCWPVAQTGGRRAADRQPGWLEFRYSIHFGCPGRGVAVHQVVGQCRYPEEDGAGPGLQLPVQ